MSRLIDADALMEYCLNQKIKTVDCNDIARFPTIEERKTGKWIISSKFDDCYYAKCDVCNIKQVFYGNKPVTNFCPNCGAKMEAET